MSPLLIVIAVCLFAVPAAIGWAHIAGHAHDAWIERRRTRLDKLRRARLGLRLP